MRKWIKWLYERIFWYHNPLYDDPREVIALFKRGFKRFFQVLSYIFLIRLLLWGYKWLKFNISNFFIKLRRRFLFVNKVFLKLEYFSRLTKPYYPFNLVKSFLGFIWSFIKETGLYVKVCRNWKQINGDFLFAVGEMLKWIFKRSIQSLPIRNLEIGNLFFLMWCLLCWPELFFYAFGVLFGLYLMNYPWEDRRVQNLVCLLAVVILLAYLDWDPQTESIFTFSDYLWGLFHALKVKCVELLLCLKDILWQVLKKLVKWYENWKPQR